MYNSTNKMRFQKYSYKQCNYYCIYNKHLMVFVSFDPNFSHCIFALVDTPISAFIIHDVG